MSPATPPRDAAAPDRPHTATTATDTPTRATTLQQPKRARTDDVRPPPNLPGKDAAADRDTRLRSLFDSEWATIERNTRIHREVVTAIVDTLDTLREQFDAATKPDQHRLVAQYTEDLAAHLRITAFAASGGATADAPPQASSTRSASTQRAADSDAPPTTDSDAPPTTDSETSTSYASAARKGRGGQQAPPGAPPAQRNEKAKPAVPVKKPNQEDTRILVRMAGQQPRMPPYTAKLALIRKLGLEGWMIRSINRTNTGWAVKTANMEIRDKLLEPENKASIQATLGASAVDIPEEWVMYVVPKVPATVPDPDTGGPITITPDMVLAEARDQTGASPIDAHLSRHGVNPETGDATCAGIIYLSGFMIPKGKSLLDMLGGQPLPWMKFEGDRVSGITEMLPQVAFNDLDPESQARWSKEMSHTSAVFFSAPSCVEPWNDGVPCAYIYSELDNALPLPIQQQMAEQLGPLSVTVSIKAGHCSHLSMPNELVATVQVIESQLGNIHGSLV